MVRRKPNKSIKLNTKVTPEDYALLLKACEEYNFSSVYKLMQDLLHCFLRHTSPKRDEEFEDGMSVEIEMMFEELGHPELPAPTYGRRYPKRQIR